MPAFGRYQLEQRIGLGGMGEVYLGRMTGAEGFERAIAIKVILPDLGDDPEFQKMFVEEAKISMYLQHANIVQVLDLGKVNDRYYIAMEFVEGPNLARVHKLLSKRGQMMPVPLAVYVLMETLKGLHHAHTARDRTGKPLSIVHRDATPQNILLSMAGEVKITDFGIARAATRAQRTQTGVVRGKLLYLSPEQFETNAPLGPWTDVFSAGMILWTLLTGKNPLDGIPEPEVIGRLQRMEPVIPSTPNPLIPPMLHAVILRAVEPVYTKRYRTAAEFLDGLEEFVLKNQIKTGPRVLAELLRGMAIQEATDRGLPVPPGLTDGPVTAATPTTPVPISTDLSQSISLPLIIGNAGISSLAPDVIAPPPLAPDIPIPVAVPPPAVAGGGATSLAIAAAMVTIGMLVIAASFVAGWKLSEPPVVLPAVASHAAPMPAGATVGWLFIDPFPWGQVSIDGSASGATPVVGRALPPGPHTLELRTVDGRVETRTVEIKAGRPTVVR